MEPQQSLVPRALSAFSTCENIASTAQSFDVTGSDLSADITVTAPSGYEVSTDNSSFSSSVTLSRSGSSVSSTPVYVRVSLLQLLVVLLIHRAVMFLVHRLMQQHKMLQ